MGRNARHFIAKSWQEMLKPHGDERLILHHENATDRLGGGLCWHVRPPGAAPDAVAGAALNLQVAQAERADRSWRWNKT
jgi:hypothetical protein